jgi:CSLREA domain-containing protein
MRVIKTSRAIAGMAGAWLVLAAPAGAATIPVNTLNDGVVNDGNCTIREALNAARLNAAGNGCVAGDAGTVDTISLDASGIYGLTGASGDDANAGGDLDFTFSPTADAGVIIQGDPGASPTDTDDKIGQPGLADRVLDVISSGPVTLDTVTIQNGTPPGPNDLGGGIEQLNGVPLTLIDSVVRASHAGSSGGGIGSIGALTVTDSVIGGATAADANSSRVGGGISSFSNLELTRTTVSNNVATFPANGSSAEGIAGGGVATSGNNATITDSTIKGNKAVAGELIDPTSKGGLEASNTNLTMTGTTVSGNMVQGGTNANTGGMSVEGGGASTSTILNSTISGNSVDTGTGTRSIGGLLVSTGATVTLAHSTVTGNTAPASPSGILANIVSGSLTIRGDLIDQGATGCSGPITADAFNVDAGTSCVGATDDTDIETASPPIALDTLSPLNGGPTATHALLGTPNVAVDAVPASACKDLDGTSPLLVDQRGAERPFGSACDAGSYERVTCGGFLPGFLGGPGDDSLTGLIGTADAMVGSAGNDTIDGLSGNDFLCGGSGNDTLTGGPGQDQIFGDSGNDTVLTKDGVADTVDCGPGTDTATFDHGLDAVTGCEIDTDPPPATGGGTGTTTPPPTTRKKCKKPKKKTKAAKKKFKKCKKRLRQQG